MAEKNPECKCPLLKDGKLEDKLKPKGNVSGFIGGLGRMLMAGLYIGLFAWIFMPMCDMQKQDRLYPGYNIPKIAQAKRKEKSVALIPVAGMIGSDVNAGANSEVLLAYIDEAVNSGADGFIFEINSGGGLVLPSKDVMERIRRLDQPKVAVIRDVGASGAYWIASACDYIIADETSTVGSIGVRMDRFDISELMRKLGIEYDPITAGAHKTMGSPYEKLPEGERQILESMVNELHELFIASVAENRRMEIEEVRPLATGEIFLGSRAFVNRLVDDVGGRAEAAEWMYGQLRGAYEIELYKQSRQQGLFGLASSFGKAVGEGFGNSILEYTVKQP